METRTPEPDSITHQRRLDKICDQFESEWKRGRQPSPSLDEFLKQVNDGDLAKLFCEMLAIELYYRNRNGIEQSQETYIEHWPEFEAEIAHCFQAEKLGRKIGPFLLHEQIGAGGFGTVYRATDTRIDRTVALKIPLAELNSAQSDRFMREARSAAKLSHPHIVSVFEAESYDDTFVIASEFVEGTTLNGAIEAQFSFSESAELIATVAEAIHYAHSMNVVHRDIKPENILINTESRPLVTDFGLARSLDADASLTHDGAIIGTPAYMSPEQAQGKGHLAGPKSDQWSIGVVFFELLTGNKLYDGTSHQVIAKLSHPEKEPTSPRTLNSAVPIDLATICQKCLSKDIERRYDTCQELANDLRRWLSNDPIHARPVSIFERSILWARRNPVTAMLLSTLVAVIAVSFGIVFSFWRDAESARAAAEKNFTEVEKQRDLVTKEKERANQNLDWARRAVENTSWILINDAEFRDSEKLADTRAKLMTTAINFYEDVVKQRSDDPLLEAGRGRAYWLTAVARSSTSQKAQALAAAQQMQEIFENLSKRFPNNADYRFLWGWSFGWQSILQRDLKRNAEAEPMCIRATEILEDTLKQHPGHAGCIVKLGSCFMHRGSLAEDDNRIEDALNWYVKAIGQLQIPVPPLEAGLQDHELYMSMACERASRLWLKTDRIDLAPSILEGRLKLNQDNPDRWYELALAYLATTNTEKYRSLCLEMARNFSGTTDIGTGERVIYTSVLAPGAIDDFETLYRYAERAQPNWSGNVRLYAAIAFRQGDFQKSIRFFEKADEGIRRGWDWFFFAMALEKSGEHERALETFQTAKLWLDRHEQEDPLTKDDWRWTEKIESIYLYREAQDLFENK